LAAVFIYPSLFEGFGFPVAEALKCGTPVITSNNSSLSEIVGNSAILINPENPEEIVLALRELLLDRKLKDRLKVAGLNQVKKFNWVEAAKETLEIFQKV
jgi:glycosyltransferase involved in cell wall biosynthesis